MPTPAAELSKLSPVEKLRLIERLWNELTPDPAAVPVEDWQTAELDRREAVAASSPQAGRSWADAKADLLRR